MAERRRRDAERVAYVKAPLSPQIPGIECLACGARVVLVGTADGGVVYMNVEPESTEVPIRDRSLLSHVEQRGMMKLRQSRSAVVQLAVVESITAFLMLQDGEVTMYELYFSEHERTPRQRCTVSGARGCTAFAVTELSSTGILRLACVVKRKILFYVWNVDTMQFEPIDEVTVSDVPRNIAWLGHTQLCVATPKLYLLVSLGLASLGPAGSSAVASAAAASAGDAASTSVRELRASGRAPLVAPMASGRLVVGLDYNIGVLDGSGTIQQQLGSPWSQVPSTVVVRMPYVLALTQNQIEIKTVHSLVSVQRIEEAGMRCLVACDQGVYVASNDYVFRLALTTIAGQIDELMQSGHFDEALALCSYLPKAADHDVTTSQIYLKYGYQLLSENRFQKAVEQFMRVKHLEVGKILSLFPEVLSEKRRGSVAPPMTPPAWSESDLTEAYGALVDLLMRLRDERKDVFTESDRVMVDSALVRACILSRQRHRVDMLRSLLQTDNAVNPVEVSALMREHNLFYELIELYEKKSMHSEVLELLRERSSTPSSKIRVGARTVEYLKRLGSEHRPLITGALSWLMEEFPNDAIEFLQFDAMRYYRSTHGGDAASATDSRGARTTCIFTPLEAVDQIDKTNKRLAIGFLEYIVEQLGSTDPFVHDLLAEKYIEVLRDPQTFADSLKMDVYQLEKDMRTRFSKFIMSSKQYNQSDVLAKLPETGFDTDRVLLLSMAGRHEEALGILVNVGSRLKHAEEYCERVYSKDPVANAGVFMILLKHLLKPAVKYHNPKALVEECERITSLLDSERAFENVPPQVVEIERAYALDRSADDVPGNAPIAMQRLDEAPDDRSFSVIALRQLHAWFSICAMPNGLVPLKHAAAVLHRLIEYHRASFVGDGSDVGGDASLAGPSMLGMEHPLHSGAGVGMGSAWATSERAAQPARRTLVGFPEEWAGLSLGQICDMLMRFCVPPVDASSNVDAAKIDWRAVLCQAAFPDVPSNGLLQLRKSLTGARVSRNAVCAASWWFDPSNDYDTTGGLETRFTALKKFFYDVMVLPDHDDIPWQSLVYLCRTPPDKGEKAEDPSLGFSAANSLLQSDRTVPARLRLAMILDPRAAIGVPGVLEATEARVNELLASQSRMSISSSVDEVQRFIVSEAGATHVQKCFYYARSLKPVISKALSQPASVLLGRHIDKFDPLDVLKVLPDDVSLSRFELFLKRAYRRIIGMHHNALTISKLLHSEGCEIDVDLLQEQTRSVHIEETTMCVKCWGKIGRSAFVLMPNGDLLHQGCAN